MSNENQEALPEYLKSRLQQQNGDSDSLASSSMSIPRVSLRGRKFRLTEGGEELAKPSDSLDVVILAVEPGTGFFIKTYYEGGYQSGDNSPPTCASSNGQNPDGWVTSPVNDRCNTCRMNQFGSATSRTGKKAKACRDSKRLWVAKPDDIDGTVFAMGVPVTSLKNVSEYGRKLKTNGYPLAAVITTMTMEDAEYPQVEFAMKGFLPETEGLLALNRSVARNWNIGAASTAPQLEHNAAERQNMLPPVNSVKEDLGANPGVTDVAAKPAPVGDILGNW